MVRKKILNSKLAGIIRHYSRILKQSGIGFEEIILFGSQAKGTARKWSDIDLAIVSTDFGKDSHAELVKLLNIRDDISIDIEPHPFHPQDLEEKWDSLAAEIRKNGIVVEQI